MPWGIASSTDPKIANFIRMSPSMTEITLGCQIMMCHVTWCQFPAGRADIHGAGESMVTEIRANVTLGIGGAGARVLDKDLRGRQGDPLSFSNLDVDDIVISYWGGSR